MDLSAVEIPRAGARSRAAEYSRQAKRTRDAATAAEYQRIALVYRCAAKDDIALVSLSSTIANGGTITRTRVFGAGGDHERREHALLPKVAACRSSARFAFTLGVEKDGGLQFVDQLYPAWNYRSGRISLERESFVLPDGYKPGEQIGQWDSAAWSALVPIVPPKHMPRVNTDLSKYVTLWEVEDWTWRTSPAPPRDPALLQHLAGDFYAVLATWDLTEVERLVLSGRRL